MAPMLKLESWEGDILTVEVEVAKASTTIKNMLQLTDDGGEGEGDDMGLEDVVIPVKNVKTGILKKVIEWIKHYQEEEKKRKAGLQSPNQGDGEDAENKPVPVGEGAAGGRRSSGGGSSSWDRWFLDVDQGTLFGLIQAANYLDIEDLLDITSKKIADMLRGRTPEEIRKLFNVKNDLTPEEDEQAKKKFEFLEESMK